MKEIFQSPNTTLNVSTTFLQLQVRGSMHVLIFASVLEVNTNQ
jgi:hypothetical protein